MSPEERAELKALLRETLDEWSKERLDPLFEYLNALESAIDRRRENDRARKRRSRDKGGYPHMSRDGSRDKAGSSRGNGHVTGNVTGKGSPNGSLPSSPSHTLPLTPNTPLPFKLIAENQASPEPKTPSRKPKDWDEFWAYCQKKGVKHDEAVYFFSTWEGNGWTTNKQPIKNWRGKVVSWHTIGYFEKSKNNGPIHPR